MSSGNKMRLAGMDSGKKTFCMNHSGYTAQDLMFDGGEMSRKLILKDIALMHYFNVKNAVLKWSNSSLVQIPTVSHVRQVLSDYDSKDILLHIGSLQWDFADQRKLIDVAWQSGMRFGACFDIEYTRLWNEATFNKWLDWVSELSEHGTSLAFHFQVTHRIPKCDTPSLPILAEKERALILQFQNAISVLDWGMRQSISESGLFADDFEAYAKAA